MTAELAFTGERFVPGARGEIWIEHWHRYHFAASLAAGRRVADVACGEGYGSALIARMAAQVTGVDVSAEAIAHARAAYRGMPRLDFVEAPCTKLPLADASVDLFVSFETIEHIAEQESFVEEIARVLTPEGLLVLSCPNKLEYSDRRGFTNPFHVKELYREQLAALVRRRFPHARWFGQRPTFFSVIAAEPRVETGQLLEVAETDPAEAAGHMGEPLYFLVAASRSAATVEAVPAALSVLTDRDDWVHRDYEKVMRELEAVVARGEALERQVMEREAAVQSLRADFESAMVSARKEARQAADGHTRQLWEQQRLLEAKDAQIAQKDAEILRRRGWRWWLRLPFVRLGWLQE